MPFLQLLGRSNELKKYVRNGKTECWTEIRLAAGEGKKDYVVYRKIEVGLLALRHGKRHPVLYEIPVVVAA